MLTLAFPWPAAGAARDFRFAFIGDRTGSHVPNIYERAIQEIELLGPEFVVSVGDEIEGYTEDPAVLATQWDEYRRLIASLSMPFHHCAGNHDITTDGMLEAYRGATGVEPCYSFDHEGVHFVMLDTGRWETSADWTEKSGYADWLRRDLQDHRNARLTIVVYHKPYWYATIAEGQPDPMHAIFRENGVDAVFNGHFHVYGAATYDGIRYTIVGSSGGALDVESDARGSFFHFVWCDVRGDSLDWEIVKLDGMLDRDEITIADHKLLDRIDTDILRPEPFVDPGAGSERALTWNLRNPLNESWTYELSWDSAPGWTITPASASLPLEGGAGASLPFTIARTGAFYPLPVLHAGVPCRPGRVYAHAGPLPVRRVQAARAAREAPVIDARLDDSCWSGAPSATEFGAADGGPCAIEPTSIGFLYDERCLYIATQGVQREAAYTVQGAARDDGAIVRDDCVGFFLCPDSTGATVHQIYWNAAGFQFDQKLTRVSPGNYAGDRAWNLSCRSAALRGEGEWTCEIAIPFDSLGASPPRPGDAWRVNFRRKEIARGGSADWQVPIGYDPEKFGLLVFE